MVVIQAGCIWYVKSDVESERTGAPLFVSVIRVVSPGKIQDGTLHSMCEEDENEGPVTLDWTSRVALLAEMNLQV